MKVSAASAPPAAKVTVPEIPVAAVAPPVEVKEPPKEAVQLPPKQVLAPTTAVPAATAIKPAVTGGIEERLSAFSKQSGIALAVNGREFSDLRYYHPALEVPQCFSKYNGMDHKVCKTCPIKLDCMMADGE
jgi:hypothetical protein